MQRHVQNIFSLRFGADATLLRPCADVRFIKAVADIVLKKSELFLNIALPRLEVQRMINQYLDRGMTQARGTISTAYLHFYQRRVIDTCLRDRLIPRNKERPWGIHKKVNRPNLRAFS